MYVKHLQHNDVPIVIFGTKWLILLDQWDFERTSRMEFTHP